MDPITIDEAIKIVPGGVDAASIVIWIVHAVALIAAYFCGLKSAHYFSEDQNEKGFVGMVGVFICGAAPSLASYFTFN